MSDITTVLSRLRDQLVEGIPRYERRRRRVRAGATGAIAGLMLLAAVVITTNEGSDRGGSVDVSTADSDIATTELSDGGVPSILIGSNGNDLGISVSDLDAGVSVTYPDSLHTAEDRGAVSGATMTMNGDLIVWGYDQPAVLYPAQRSDDGPDPLADGRLQEPGRQLNGMVGERTILPVDRGDRAWVLGAGDGSSEMPLEVVDLSTGDVELSTSVSAGSTLVDTVGADAVLSGNRGGAAAEAVRVSPTGDRTSIRSPEPARLVAATASQTVWLAGGDPGSVSGDRLLVSDGEGTTTTLPTPADGDWVAAGAPSMPSNSPPLRTMNGDGARLVLALTDRLDPNGTANRVVVADLQRGTSEVVYEGAGASSAFWARDDRTVIVISDGAATGIDTVTGATSVIDDAVPEDYFVIAGR